MQQEFCHLRIEPPKRPAYYIRMKLNLRIRELRKQRKLTLEQLAPKLQISVPHLSEIERGKKNLNNHIITRLCEAFRVKPRDLFVDERDADEAELSLILENLDAKDKDRVRDFARALQDVKKARGPAA